MKGSGPTWVAVVGYGSMLLTVAALMVLVFVRCDLGVW
jgi:hypothetical protein